MGKDDKKADGLDTVSEDLVAGTQVVKNPAVEDSAMAEDSGIGDDL